MSVLKRVPRVSIAGERIVDVSSAVAWERFMTVLRAVGSTGEQGESFTFRDPTSNGESGDMRLRIAAMETGRWIVIAIEGGTDWRGSVNVALEPLASATRIKVGGQIIVPGGWVIALVMRVWRGTMRRVRDSLEYGVLFELESLAAGVEPPPHPDRPADLLPLTRRGGGRAGESRLLRIHRHVTGV